jgi:hypothetical protein
MGDVTLDKIADLAIDDSAPRANFLTPDVRSGTSFTYSATGRADIDKPPFYIVWAYTVHPKNRKDFADKIKDLEDTGDGLPLTVAEFTYRGTYSVSISSIHPELEYRTLWSASDLSQLDKMNTYLRDTPMIKPRLAAVLELIEPLPAMRSEIMGRTGFAATVTGTSASTGPGQNSPP